MRAYAREHGFEEDLPWLNGKNYDESKAIDLQEYMRTTEAMPTPSKSEMRQRILDERKTAARDGQRVQYMARDNNLDEDTRSNCIISKTAESNFDHLVEVLFNGNREGSNRGQGHDIQRQQFERNRGAYTADAVESTKTRKDICDANRRAQGVQRERVSLTAAGEEVNVDINQIKQKCPRS